MEKQNPDYTSKSNGYILVNTLPEEYLRKEHIPHSLNVTQDSLTELKRNFEPAKQIIVYCASQSCDSSAKALQELETLGFANVTDFEGGMEAWKEAGGAVESGQKQPAINVSN